MGTNEIVWTSETTRSEKIKAVINLMGIGAEWLSGFYGCSKGYARRLMAGGAKDIKLCSYIRLCDALGLPINTLMQETHKVMIIDQIPIQGDKGIASYYNGDITMINMSSIAQRKPGESVIRHKVNETRSFVLYRKLTAGDDLTTKIVNQISKRLEI